MLIKYQDVEMFIDDLSFMLWFKKKVYGHLTVHSYTVNVHFIYVFLLLLFLSFLLKFEKILPDIEIKETVLSYLSEGMENSLSCSNSFIICKSKQNVEKLSFWKCITIDGWVIWKLRNRWSICTYLITYFITLLYN